MHLLRHIPGKLLIVRDGLPGHRSGAVWDFVRQQKGCLWQALRRMRRRPTLVIAFWQQAELFPM